MRSPGEIQLANQGPDGRASTMHDCQAVRLRFRPPYGHLALINCRSATKSDLESHHLK
jgi:hypothetical protein